MAKGPKVKDQGELGSSASISAVTAQSIRARKAAEMAGVPLEKVELKESPLSPAAETEARARAELLRQLEQPPRPRPRAADQEKEEKDKELYKKIDKARETVAQMSSDQRMDMRQAQAQSWAIGEAGMGSDADEAAYRTAVTNKDWATVNRLKRESAMRQRETAIQMQREAAMKMRRR